MTSEAPERTRRAEAALHHAQEETVRLTDDPQACLILWESTMVPFIPPEHQAEARAAFRRHIQDAGFRIQFAWWVYLGALELYQQGDLD